MKVPAADSDSTSSLRNALAIEVNSIREAHGLITPPIDPFKVSRIGRAKIDFIFLPPHVVGAPGSIEPTDDGFKIKLDQNLRRALPTREFRLRSRAAHELMHALFYNTSILPPIRPWKGPSTRRSYLIEEELCNYLAREFLVPSSVLRSEIDHRPYLRMPSITHMNILKEKFQVSSDILAYKLIRDANVWKGMFAKYLKTGTIFKVSTRVKSKSGPVMQKLKIQPFIDRQPGYLQDLLREGVAISSTGHHWETKTTFFGREVKFEAERDSIDPLTIIFLVYDNSATQEMDKTAVERFSDAFSSRDTQPTHG